MSGSRLFSSKMNGESLVQIPYLPAKVALEDLSADGCLLSQEQLRLLARVKEKLLEQRRYSKQEISDLIKAELDVDIAWPYSLIFHDDCFYAIYKGEKHDAHLGKGEHGKVKLAQCLSDNVFYALKLQSDAAASNQEFEMLLRVCETPQTSVLASRTTGSDEPQSMILMKLARGQDIDKITEQELLLSYDDDEGHQVIDGLMKPVLRIQLALDALVKLDKLHLVRHVIHRDLQPGNIVLDIVAQHARLIDYGQAMVAQQVDDLKRSGSERGLKGSTRNYSPQLRRHLPEIKRALSEGNENLVPEVTYDRDDEMYGIGISLASFFHLLDPIPEDLEETPEKWGSHLIDNAVADAYLPYYHILPIEVYRKVLALIRQMTEEDAHNRISFDVAIDKFTMMLNELRQAGATISVGLLNLAEINADNLASVIESVQRSAVDEVFLADNSGAHKTVLELLTIQRQLQDAGLRVGAVCFKGTSVASIERAAVDYLAKRPIPSQHQWVAAGKTLTDSAAAAASSPQVR